MCQKSATVYGEVGAGKKKHKKEEKTVVKKCWLLKLTGNVTSALHQKFLQTYKIKEFAFITHCETHGKMENTTSLDLDVPSFNHRRILCTKILNQLKMFKKKKSFNFLH